MRVVVETPKWGFVKYKFEGGKFVRDFLSPLPTLFNYGFAPGELSEDGMPRDALVLGPRQPQGTKVNYAIAGIVQFQDAGVEDNKVITNKDGKIGRLDRLKLEIFFRFYALFKKIRYLVTQRRLIPCKYKGIIVSNMQ